MTDADKIQFAESMRGLKEVYTPDKPLSAEKIEIYWRYFNNWKIEKFQRACARTMDVKTITTFPLPAEIVLADRGNGNNALSAWLIARTAVSRHGAYITVCFEDKTIHSVIEAMGGWQKFCWIPDNEITWGQKEFERYYPILYDKTEHSKTLQGMHEAKQIVHIKTDEPKQIEEQGEE